MGSSWSMVQASDKKMPPKGHIKIESLKIRIGSIADGTCGHPHPECGKLSQARHTPLLGAACGRMARNTKMPHKT